MKRWLIQMAFYVFFGVGLAAGFALLWSDYKLNDASWFWKAGAIVGFLCAIWACSNLVDNILERLTPGDK